VFRAFLVTSVFALHGIVPTLGHAQGDDRPLNAIGWLEDALTLTQPDTAVALDAPLGTALPETIAVTPLGTPQLDALGLFDPARIGLPRDLWGQSPVAEVIAALASLPADTTPTALQLGFRLLLAEFTAPQSDNAPEQGSILNARLDKLIAMGALEQASTLIDASPVQTAALNKRAFDIALLLGEEDRACARMSGQVTADYGHGAQIFCLARRGEWQSAYAMLNTTRALGLLPDADAGLLLRFLAEEDEDFPLPPPSEITPLGWRVLEALGDPVPTAALPVAFAHADLRGTSGWRAQLDAAERLTRAGVMQPNRLLGLYAQRRAAASGGVWERVQAVQALDAALTNGDLTAISRALTTAWPLFAAVELDVALSQMFAERMADLDLTGLAREKLWTMLMLAQDRPDRASALAPQTDRARLAIALATGAALPDVTQPPMAVAIHDAFGDTPLPETLALPLQSGAVGVALLQGLSLIAQGAAGDPHGARQGLQVLHALGLDSIARQIAIDLLLIERRG
jgi:hypothetical protein